MYKPKEEFFQPAIAKKNAIDRLYKDLKTGEYKGKEIFLSFIGDPFPSQFESNYDNITAEALELLFGFGCRVSILTKGGIRALSCINQIRNFGDRIKVGATLTFKSLDRAVQYEPYAAVPLSRIDMLKVFHNLGISTWASIEPVIDHQESIRIIMDSLAYTDHYKIGKLNHTQSEVDWPKFLQHVVLLMRDNHKSFYIKKDLQAYEKLAGVVLTEREKNII
jgi:DNA repair photolyase